MPTIAIQTEEFINYLAYETKMTKLYELIRDMSSINTQLQSQNQYLKFKVETLQNSLFEAQQEVTSEHCAKNQRLLDEVVKVEEILIKEKEENRIEVRKENKLKNEYKKIKEENERWRQKENGLEKEIKKGQKENRVLRVQNQRLRKVNEEYRRKTKKLQKLAEAHEELFSTQFDSISKLSNEQQFIFIQN